MKKYCPMRIQLADKAVEQIGQYYYLFCITVRNEVKVLLIDQYPLESLTN